MSTILITLFEEQIIRNYLSDDLQILKKLLVNNNVVIFTDKGNSGIIVNLLGDLSSSKVTIIVIENFRYSQIYKICLGILRWSHNSSSIYREILSRSGNSLKAKIIMPARLLIYLLCKNSFSVEKIIRQLIFVTFDLEKFQKSVFSRYVDLEFENFNSLFVTSLTNSKDIQVALYAKKKGIKIIGTVRSWDNLSSHGRLILEPDIFYSHSDFMTDTLDKFHPYQNIEVHSLVAPNYRNIFLSKRTVSLKSGPLKIGYVCMGNVANPDDYNFINSFNRLAEDFTDKKFCIIQHPKFTHEINFKLNKNVEVFQFNYDDSSLFDYYNALSSFDLILGGGTSALFDAAVLKIPIVYIGFEYQLQNFWTSSLRYMDHMHHTEEFIHKTKVKICKSHSDLIQIISANNYEFYKVDSDVISYFAGNTDLDLSSKLLKLLS